MKKPILTLIIILHSLLVSAQLQNDSLEYRVTPDTLKAGNLELSLYNFNFLRNYEYFNNFQDGYTLFGTQLEPRLIFYPNSKLLISAGIHIRKDFGKDGIDKTYPLFTIKYKNKNTSFITGVLEGNVHHRFIEPIFDIERKINAPVEYGTQLVVSKQKLFLDAFVNWNRMIDRYSPLQEQIFAGASADVSLWRKDGLKFSLPLQLLVFHQGGQIDTDPSPLRTIANTALGLKLQSDRTTGFVRQLKTENYFVTYSEFSPTKTAVFQDGRGIFLNASIGTKFGNLTGSYWEGNQYLSVTGMPIYQSVSQQIDNPGYSEDVRRLLFLRYTYQRQLVSNFYLDFRVEPVFDLKNSGQKMDFSHSLFLVYKQDFKLFKRK
ncbi:hypothetical protein [Desertivirga brevis]|uniref:hypothetical protein n=1 Tax=Desertivirga brevis TaxID=2810310 RepID=UPI001A9753D3|nr:hypothetical protein [Pedobacter sp. SYSU D00873]